MGPVGGDFEELMRKSEEELLSMVGAIASEHPLALPALRVLEHRRVKAQAAAAAALVGATTKQAAAGDALVKATGDLVGATGRLVWATGALAVMTLFLVLVAAVQVYVTADVVPRAAWVLWAPLDSGSPKANEDQPLGAYEAQRACLAAKVAGESYGMRFVSVVARCLPDTVDPRGLKGK